MKLDEFADYLESQVADHVESVCSAAVKSVLQTTPADRVKTRQAIRLQMKGTRGTVGLKFRTRYATRGTTTLRRLESQWKALRPRLRQAFIKRLNDTLKGR